MSYGKLSKVLEMSVDTSKPTQPDIKTKEYIMGILLNCLTKAPFPITAQGVNDLPRRTATKIIAEVMNDYPLMDTSEVLMTALLGSEDIVELASKFTLPVPPSTAGTKKK